MGDAAPKAGDIAKAERAAWCSRLGDEKDALDNQIRNLQAFIQSGEFYKIHDEEKGLLTTQLSAMQALQRVLQQRIDHHKAQ